MRIIFVLFILCLILNSVFAHYFIPVRGAVYGSGSNCVDKNYTAEELKAQEDKVNFIAYATCGYFFVVVPIALYSMKKLEGD